MSRKLLIGWCLLPLFFLITSFVFAQEEQFSVSNYFYSYSKNKIFSVQAFLNRSSVSLFSQNQFLLKELCTATISGNYNIKKNAVALNVSHFGYSKYGFFTISAGYTRAFANRISLGLQVHYLLHHAESYPKVHSFTFDLSLYGLITEKMGIGISAYNPANLKYGISGKERIPMLYVLLLDYKLNDKVLLALSASKQLPGAFDVSAMVCFKYKFYGFMTDVSLKKVGVQFSFWWKRFEFDVGGSFDYRLGFSPCARVSYFIK
ncbi:MAG: hypothetical protein LBU83_01365 [Bacteroidales bacterium]|jgi:hypothetical protein|nr:hypothetical protein [Bacteroidales bacterium]